MELTLGKRVAGHEAGAVRMHPFHMLRGPPRGAAPMVEAIPVAPAVVGFEYHRDLCAVLDDVGLPIGPGHTVLVRVNTGWRRLHHDGGR